MDRMFIGVEIFFGDDCMDQFCEYVFEMSGKCRSVWIAHNGARFDALFILHWFLIKTLIAPNVIMNGNKIISVKVGNVTILDSLLFFNLSLKKLTKVLGLKLNCEKGFHPSYFYDLNYVGEIVDKKYFDLSNMSLDKWYDSYKGKE